MITSIAIALTLGACVTGDRRLPWTAETVPLVAKKCGVEGLTVNDKGIALGGLSPLRGTPPWKKKTDCLKRNIELPADFLIVTG